MMATKLAEGAFAQAIDPDNPALDWRPDHPAKGADSAAIQLQDDNKTSRIYLVDRGEGFQSPEQRYYKLQITQADSQAYQLRFAPADAKQSQTYTVQRNTAYSRVYFSFKAGGQMVEVAPPAGQWDLVFTRYTTIFFDEPLDSDFRYYSVTGGLHNRWAQGKAYAPDSAFRSQLPFDTLSAQTLPDTIPWHSDATIPGYQWKTYLFEENGFVVDTSRYYLLRDQEGFIYKLRFLDFYDDSGTKGSPAFEYQRL
jgi:hypothetical protein